MARKPIKIDIQKARAENYVTHFESRKYLKALPPELQMCYLSASQVTKVPRLNPYGADCYTDEDWKLIINLAQQRGLQAFYINPWYATDEGWTEFQRQWQELPDPRDIPDLQIDTEWITK